MAVSIAADDVHTEASADDSTLSSSTSGTVTATPNTPPYSNSKKITRNDKDDSEIETIEILDSSDEEEEALKHDEQDDPTLGTPQAQQRLSWTQDLLNRIPLLGRAKTEHLPNIHALDTNDNYVPTRHHTLPPSASSPRHEVHRISEEVERILCKAKQQLTEMDDYLSQTQSELPRLQQQQHQPIRDSAIQQSDEESQNGIPRSTPWREAPGSPGGRSSIHNQPAGSLSNNNNNINNNNRASIAASLQNRSSLYSQYSPVLEKATQVEIASTQNTINESDTTTSGSSVYNKSSSMSVKSNQRNISLRKVRESTHELESLLTQIKDLRRSTSDRKDLTEQLERAMEKKEPPSSPEDFSSSSFERQATPPESTPNTPAPATETAVAAAVAAAAASRTNKPPTPPDQPVRQMSDPEKSQLSETSGAAAMSSSTSSKHKRSVSLPQTHVMGLDPNSSKFNSADEAELDGLMDSLEGYRNRLTALNEEQQQQQQQQKEGVNFPSSPFGKQIGVPPPSRPVPPPPEPPSLPPLSYSWQQQPSLKDEMDSLLDIPPQAPFVLEKRASRDSSAADSFQTAQSPGSYDEEFHDRQRDLLPSPLVDDHQMPIHPEQQQRLESDSEVSRLPTGSSSTFPLNLKKDSSSSILAPLQQHHHHQQSSRRAVSSASATSRPLPDIPPSSTSRHRSSFRPSSATESTLSTVTNKRQSVVLDPNSTARPLAAPQLQPTAPKDPYPYPYPERERERERERDNRDRDREKYRKDKKKKKKHHSNAGAGAATTAKKNARFSQPNVERLMHLADDSFKLEELDLPPDERHLLEKFVDSLSKLSVEINLDERKKLEGKRRLQNALRALEGWI